MSERDKAARQLARQQNAADAASKPRNDPPPHNHPNVPRDTPEQAGAKDEPPDAPEFTAARELMATAKLAIDQEGHNAVLYLTDYDISKRAYNGFTVRVGSKDKPGVFSLPAYGYVPYSPDERTPYCFLECADKRFTMADLRNHMRHLAAREPVNEANE